MWAYYPTSRGLTGWGVGCTITPMKSRAAPPPTEDPRYVSVQVQARMPWWRRRQLEELAAASGTSLSTLITDALDRVHKPDPPK